MARYPVFSSRHAIGLTFLSWSYHWLAGHEYFWNAKLGCCKMPINPNTGINAHLFNKNYRAGFNEWSDFLLDHRNNVENCSLYGGAPRPHETSYVTQEYALCLKFASEHNPLIFFVESPDEPWYFLNRRNITPNQKISQDSIIEFQELMLGDFLKTYFSNSIEKFDKNIWDLRELIALNFNYFRADNGYLNEIDKSINHLRIDSKDLWYNGEECLQRIFKYLGKSIVQEKLTHWKNVYHEWQSSQLKILQFNWYVPTIVESIVKNYNFNFKFLKLSLVQEGIIQGYLIKDYNLNLQCYGLEKFPNNTSDLHLLLEENIHI